jgi:hypothetical protein
MLFISLALKTFEDLKQLLYVVNLKGTVSQKSLFGDAMDLKYEPLTCLKIFRSTILKL